MIVVVPEFAWKTKQVEKKRNKSKTDPNTKFLHTFNDENKNLFLKRWWDCFFLSLPTRHTIKGPKRKLNFKEQLISGVDLGFSRGGRIFKKF